jgi:hypothetical protein
MVVYQSLEGAQGAHRPRGERVGVLPRLVQWHDSERARSLPCFLVNTWNAPDLSTASS